MRERLGIDSTLPEALANGRRLIEQTRFFSAKPRATDRKMPGACSRKPRPAGRPDVR